MRLYCLHAHVCAIACAAFTYIDVCIYKEERMTDACVRHRRAHACDRLCWRVCACGFGRARILAEACEPFPSASTACGSACRRSSHASRRRRSTRTSARGTPRVSPRCSRYAPAKPATCNAVDTLITCISGPRVAGLAGAPVCIKVQPESCGVERGPRHLLL
jgi:hypothetical protein